jgi:hypothetical protein
MNEKTSIFYNPYFYVVAVSVLLIPVGIGIILIIFGAYFWSMGSALNKVKSIEGFNLDAYYQNYGGNVISVNPQQRCLVIYFKW